LLFKRDRHDYNGEISTAVKRGNGFMTASLSNFLLSLLAGAIIILVPAVVGLVFISQKDKIQRS
jgi:photosystem II PsbX protein